MPSNEIDNDTSFGEVSLGWGDAPYFLAAMAVSVVFEGAGHLKDAVDTTMGTVGNLARTALHNIQG